VPAVALPAPGLSTYATGVLYAVGAGIALGTLGPLSNIAYAAGMGSPTFAAMRATIGAVVLLVLAGRAVRRVPLRSRGASRRCWP
jgi:drug/metabolite transporter (DMT)-like permease